MANVYGLKEDAARSLFWDSISGFMTQWSVPWCLGGDFNMIHFSLAKRGGTYISRSMERIFLFH